MKKKNACYRRRSLTLIFTHMTVTVTGICQKELSGEETAGHIVLQKTNINHCNSYVLWDFRATHLGANPIFHAQKFI